MLPKASMLPQKNSQPHLNMELNQPEAEWIVNNKKIQLFKNEEKLKYKILENGQQIKENGFKKSKSGPNLTIDQKIIALRETYVVFKTPDFAPHFACHHSLKVKNTFDHLTIKLLCVGLELVWQLFNHSTQSTRWSSFDEATSLSLLCKSVTIESLMLKDIKERITCLKNDFWISNIFKEIDDNDSNIYEKEKMPFSVELEPMWHWSKINRNNTISTYRWGITLLTHKGSEGNHALFAVEGVERGEYFLRRVEYTSSEIISEIIPFHKLKYETKSRTWIRDSEKVYELLQQIARETPPPFSIWGRGSFFVDDDAHSCITWTREKFEKIGINLKRSFLDNFINRTKNHTYNPKALLNEPFHVDI